MKERGPAAGTVLADRDPLGWVPLPSTVPPPFTVTVP